jgi:RNA polymerase sigma factor (sigma-70 family)
MEQQPDRIQMAALPETRPSLILRLTDPDDAEAWEEFVAIYSPVLYRFARQKGLQHADAQNLVQEVVMAVARSVESWDPDPARGKFRSWLFRVARNRAINFLTRPNHKGIGTGDTGTLRWLENQPDGTEADSALFDREYRREVFHWAASKVRVAVQETTWQAFWLTSLEERPVPEVAAKLGMSPGAVYIARSRVMAKLQDQVSQWESRPKDTSNGGITSPEES